VCPPQLLLLLLRHIRILIKYFIKHTRRQQKMMMALDAPAKNYAKQFFSVFRRPPKKGCKRES